jgi:hypothetical protein
MTGYAGSTRMAGGTLPPAMARSGIRMCRPAGRPTRKAAGSGSSRGAGPGSTMRPGGLRRRITGAGRTSGIAGAGSPALSSRPPFTPRPFGFLGGPGVGLYISGAGAVGRLVSARAGRGLLAELPRRSELCSCPQPRQCSKHRRHPVSAQRTAPRTVRECAVRQSPLCHDRSTARLRERR